MVSRIVPTHLLAALLIVLSPLGAVPGEAEECHFCKRNCQACELCPVEIRCATKVVEMQMKSCVVEDFKEREETYTVFQRVPVKQKYTKKTCYLSDEIVSKEITKTQCKRVENPVERSYTMNVPVQEVFEGTRTRKVCGKCGEVCCIQEPCQCMVTRLVKETANDTYCKSDVVFEKTKKTIDYCKKTPKVKEEVCSEEVEYKLVPVEKTRKVQVCVPKIEKHPVDVVVTKMLPYEVPCCRACMEVRAKMAERQAKEHKLKVLNHDHEHKLHEKVQKIVAHEHEHKLHAKVQEKAQKLQDKHQKRHADGLLNKLFSSHGSGDSCDCEQCR